MSLNHRRLVASFVVALLISSSGVWAQQTETANQPPATPPQPERPRDPLGRDTPRGTVLGFMSAAGGNKFDVAPLYLNSGLSGAGAVELAQQLYVVLNSRLPVRVNVLSDRPEGSLVNPLKPDQDIVGTINTSGGPLELVVEHVDVGGPIRVWLFSRETLQAIPRVYQEIDLVILDGILPQTLTGPRIFGVRVFDWLMLFVGIPLLYRLLGLLGPLLGLLVRLFRRISGRQGGITPQSIHGSVRLLLTAGLIRVFALNVDLPLNERQFWAVIRGGMLIGGVVWLLLMFNRFAESYVQRRVPLEHFGESVALIKLARRVGDVIVVCLAAVVALRFFGFDPTAALAGLGIGGIAVALAAQKTLENVVGGFSLVFDKALRVGDVLKLGDVVGTVDQIGLRSTRIRTLDRTILSVPNGQISTVNIETLSERDKFWFRHVIGLRYETTPAQIRTIVSQLREMLASQPGADLETVRVRFLRLGAFSLDVELFTYIFARDWNQFLEIQEGLLLQSMEIVDKAGTAIAFPTQTLHLDAPTANSSKSVDAIPTVAT